ncbi:putative F-box/LRR-repeat/kelch-repeat protein At1g11620 isoform X1 [Rhododendron vialii]|uniref:putative F-box/LRR-repeat/kelch-repeat protein At1g11620 isoform X1 n=1 Tax=Rhododendron vialii TaxID=182163 RepID=UPI00265E10C8|nr:putative F-box/LRR-repeat/kelch-repeat protein At1g11620 isoform X1 [Rhododendron vialii]
MERRLPDLPHVIIYDILSRLPVKPLCRFKSVSKPWLALVTDPQFIKSHLNHQSTNHKKLLIHSLSPPCTCSVDCQAPDHTVAELEMPGKEPIIREVPKPLFGILWSIQESQVVVELVHYRSAFWEHLVLHQVLMFVIELVMLGQTLTFAKLIL